MSFIKVGKGNIELASVTLRPTINFVSSSKEALVVTGSQKVSPFYSKCVKTIDPLSTFSINGGVYDENAINVRLSLDSAVDSFKQGNTNIEDKYSVYLDNVSDATQDPKLNKTIDVFRFDLPTRFNENANIKNVFKKTLNSFYKHKYPNLGYHYTNYHTLNFFTSSNTPDDSCLIYPNYINQYTGGDGFTLDFWINPRYTWSGNYNAGTIFHMSSSIALSIVTGSSLNEDNKPDKFKLLLQLSHSADYPPSSFDISTAASLSTPYDLVFTSSKDLELNNWHHVCIRHSINNQNLYGDIIIDDHKTSFYLTSSIFSSNEIITLGNYLDTSSTNAALFFNQTVSANQGLTKLTTDINEPSNIAKILSNPLNAEIHDVKLFKEYLSDSSRDLIKFKGINNKNIPGTKETLYDKLSFYVPGFFYSQTRSRNVHVTPFQTKILTTDTPFNTYFSFGINGKLINLENFTREFIKGEFPRLNALTASTINTTIQNLTADEYVYHSGSIKKRNLTILPNDNGLFSPDYYPIEIAAQTSSISYPYRGNEYDYSRVNLNNLIPTSSYFGKFVLQSGVLFDGLPDSFTIAQRLKDVSSNEVTIFDISNIYYGNKINPKTFVIKDNGLTGSDDTIKIQLKDNGNGILYRADSITKHATNNNVGDIIYEEGMICIKSPNLFYFCKDRTDISFRGEYNLHTLAINIPVESNLFNSSSNPTFKNYPPTQNKNDEHLKSIFISGVNIHDNNFNIIMKANFSQPILKTEEDEFVIRLKMDF
jgi:hypothetical protein